MIGVALAVSVPSVVHAEEAVADKKQSLSSDQAFIKQIQHVIARLLINLPGVGEYPERRAIKFGPTTAEEADACREKHHLNGPHPDLPEWVLKLDCSPVEITQKDVDDAINAVLPFKLSS
ncbi:MAG: hypothetical protein Q4A31_07075 [Corynebacterium sp.]|uniref:hypothetical protein n=1 Tax=Corynebacterium sp. TaxID=1720 RepID=UPI0026DC512C|nr:hypothetical protein [Corynebacterium sp.]MDO4761662.1 hypothetical protein [Corynebacterium sp.]